MMADKVKKPFYKKWWFWLIVIILVIGIASTGDDDDQVAETSVEAETKEDENTDEEVIEEEIEEATEEESTEAAEEDEETEEESSDEIAAGTYKVGTDIEPGEYLVFADGPGYIEASKDSSGQIESIIFNDNLLNDAHAYVTLNDGEYFKLERAYMYPVESAPSVVPEDGVYTDGMYKVGEDIPAGEYRVELNESSVMGMGYLEVSSDSRHQIDSIITNDNVQADTYITVQDGQYLKIQDLTITVE